MPRSLAALALLLLPAVAVGKPAHKQALAGHLGPFLTEKLNDCRLCHQPGDTKPDEEKPRNPFGEQLEETRKTLRAAGKPFDIPARFDAVTDEDADGDGVPNLLEILTGHLPGDPADKPTADELKAADERMAKYRKFRAAYPWTPYQKVTRPPLPAVTNPEWAANPIDRFLSAAHAEHGLTPRPVADKLTLIRRVTLDLSGLPPTAEEIEAFLKDDSPAAYERVVDRLLASPRYGERWGRHWMDVWRYSDWAGWTDGGQIRDSQPHIWRWRDWIVESLNADKPYSRMVQEMLAGDELAPDDPDTLRATGFVARNYKMLSREVWLQEVVDHTFLAFQATTLKCARCHDHFFDPLGQKEYYAVRAIFTPHKVRLDRVPGQPDTKRDGLARVYDADISEPTYLLVRGDDRTPDKSAPVPPGVPAVFGLPFPKVTPVKLPPSAVAPDGREFVAKDELAAATAAATTARKKATEKPSALAELDAALAETKRDALVAVIEADRAKTDDTAKRATVAQRRAAVVTALRDTFAADVKKKASAEEALKKAEAEAAKPVTAIYTKRAVPTYPAESTGRRTALAQWLTDPANPLTARVAVNHVWLRHFGQALVPSVFDFGKNGRRPTHPALLDYLAAEFMASGWQMKPLHKLIVTSRAYRSASTPTPDGLAKDRDNLHHWRFAPRRLEAEAVRDQLLFVAGKLDLTAGGPDIDHAQALEVPRRSLYFRHAHEKQAEFLKLFDTASVTECYERRESIIPQQALALANSPLSARLARELAGQLPAGEAARVAEAAYRRVLGRPPTAAELSECVDYLGASPDAGRRAGLVNALFNHHEFVTVR